MFERRMATSSSRSAGRHLRELQRQQPRPTDRHDDVDEEDDKRSQDSLDSSPVELTSPRCLSRDDVLASLGYRSGNVAQPSTQPSQPQRSNTCRRCAKKVYPLELIDVGDCYHRGCFKCYVSEHCCRILIVLLRLTHS